MSEWRTITREAGALVRDGERIKGASFQAHAFPLAPTELAEATSVVRARVAELRRSLRDAVHHAYAFRVAPEPADFGWSDDGEPVGSAGRAILQRIDHVGLVNLAVIVSRWQGGQKLAVTDLAKGYGDAARAVLAAATVVPFVPTTCYALAFDYTTMGVVQGVLAAFGAEHESADYGTEVRVVVRVTSARSAAFEAAIRDASAGRVTAVRTAR